jgi:hypothetical protein
VGCREISFWETKSDLFGLQEGPLNFVSFGSSRRFVEGEEIAVTISAQPILPSSALKPANLIRSGILHVACDWHSPTEVYMMCVPKTRNEIASLYVRFRWYSCQDLWYLFSLFCPDWVIRTIPRMPRKTLGYIESVRSVITNMPSRVVS